MDDAPVEPVLAMLPEVDAREVLAERTLSLRLLRPPFPAIGLGTLRVLRAVERDGVTELVAGYDGYERVGMRERAGSAR